MIVTLLCFNSDEGGRVGGRFSLLYVVSNTSYMSATTVVGIRSLVGIRSTFIFHQSRSRFCELLVDLVLDHRDSDVVVMMMV